MKLNDIIAGALQNIVDKVRDETITCTDEEISKTLDELAKFNTERPMSKEEACIYMNMSRSVFDTHIRNGLIPHGKKRMGFKELSWNKPELDKALVAMKNYGF